MWDLKPLWELQQLEEQYRSLERKLKSGELAGKVAGLKEKVLSKKQALENLKEEHRRLGKEIKVKEMESKSLAGQLAKMKEMLYSGSITSSRELEAAERKVKNLEAVVDRLEEEILLFMERQDELEKDLNELEALLKEDADFLRQVEGSYLAAQHKLKQLLLQMPAARQKILDKVEPELYKKYLDMKRKYFDPVARVARGICTGCHVSIPFCDLKLLKEGGEVVFCAHCGRMLYWEK